MNGGVLCVGRPDWSSKTTKKLGKTSGRALMEWLLRQTTGQRGNGFLIRSLISCYPEIP
jgi:hypothetical protein